MTPETALMHQAPAPDYREQLRDAWREYRQAGGATIARMIAVGVAYIDLKEATKPRRFGKTLEDLGVCGREARRFQELADSDWYEAVENGPAGSAIRMRIPDDVLARLTIDIQKLVWMSRIRAEQLREFLDRVQIEKITSRVKLIQAVKEEIEYEAPASKPRPVRIDIKIQATRRRIQVVVDQVEQVRANSAIDDDARQRYERELAGDVTRLYELLVPTAFAEDDGNGGTTSPCGGPADEAAPEEPLPDGSSRSDHRRNRRR
jgi:hypothetical protein